MDDFTDSHFYGFTKGKLSDGWGVYGNRSKRPGEPLKQSDALESVHTLCYDYRTGKIVERGIFESEGRNREKKKQVEFPCYGF